MRGFNLNPVLVIIVINFVFYIATLINSDILVNLGVIPAIFTERPWTVLTAMFVHSGFWHIFGNMLVLYFFGRAIYQLVGSNKFLLVYFIGGVVGNLLYVLIADPLSIAVGASGAVYAIAGVLVVLNPNTRVLLWFFIPMPLWVVVLIFFVLWSFIPGLGIAWQAHIGGLVVGLIAGYFFRRKYRIIIYR
jgi:membrane associated rhomboid family serine protease